MTALRVGTRKSRLARAQTGLVLDLLRERGLDVEEVLIESRGDADRTRPLYMLGAPGAFTAALEQAILAGEIDAAVHSLKDLPLAQPEDAPVAAVLARHDARDVLLVRRDAHAPDRDPLPLKRGARVGTSAPRRQTQVQEVAPDVIPTDLRGNVDTRIRLLQDGVIDAILLAGAAFERVHLELPENVLALHLPLDRFPTAPGQGALAVQCRRDSPHHDAIAALDDPATRAAVEAERGVLAGLGGGCGLPLGVHVWPEGDDWRMRATFAHPEWRVSAKPRVRRFAATLEGAAPSSEELHLLVDAAIEKLQESWLIMAEGYPSHEGPLRGTKVLLAMSPETASAYVQAVEAKGGLAAAWATLRTTPYPVDPVPDGVRDAWARAGWVALTSSRAVDAARALQALTPGRGPKFAAVGPATTRALRAAGLPVHLVSPDGTARGLADVLLRTEESCTVLAPGAREPRPDLRDALQAAGFEVVEWPVYETRPVEKLGAPPLPTPVTAIVVGSPSSARALPQDPEIAERWIAFGPSTAEALRARGLPVHAVPERRSPEGVLDALKE